MRPNIKYHPRIDINDLSTLHAAFPDLLYARMTGYSAGENKVCEKLTIYKIGLASFTMSNQLQIDRSFSGYLLSLVNFFPLCFYVQTVW